MHLSQFRLLLMLLPGTGFGLALFLLVPAITNPLARVLVVMVGLLVMFAICVVTVRLSQAYDEDEWARNLAIECVLPYCEHVQGDDCWCMADCACPEHDPIATWQSV